MNPAALELAANAGLRRYCMARHERPGMPALARPDEVAQWHLKLGTHPDLIARLWDALPATLPVDCRMIFYGTPVLMHPATGMVFGFAGGTHTYALRLPAPEHAAALRAGATRIAHYPAGQPSLDLESIGPDWVFGRWRADESAWCLAAFAFAGADDLT